MIPPQFQAFMEEFFSDKRGVLFPVANISPQAVALDSARLQEEAQLTGDFLYADSESTGTLFVKFNNPSMPWIPFKANTSIFGFPIQRVFFKNSAQAGKIVNLLYGYGARIIPPNADIANITGTVNTFDTGDTFDSSFESSTVLTANTPENVLAAASNVNGVRVVRGAFTEVFGATSGKITLLSKATAPTTPIDGQILFQNRGTTQFLIAAGTTTNCTSYGLSDRPIKISLARRLDFISDTTSIAPSYRNLKYTAL